MKTNPDSPLVCILHTGLHKTGTTAIQEFLAFNREAMLGAGVYYPDLLPFATAPEKAHHRFFRNLGVADKGLSGQQRMELVGNWAAVCRRESSVLLLSAESLSYYPKPGAADDWSRGRKEFLLRVRSELEPFKVRPVVVLRRQDGFIESLYKEWVYKNFDYSGLPLCSFINAVRDSYLRFHENLRLLNTVFQSVSVLSYHRLSEGDLGMGFLESLGMAVDGVAASKRVRESLSVPETLVKRHLNEIGHPLSHHAAYRKFLSHEPFKRWLDGEFAGGPVGLWPDLAWRRDFLSQFAWENAVMENEFYRGEKLFPGFAEEDHTEVRHVEELTERQKETIDVIADGGVS